MVLLVNANAIGEKPSSIVGRGHHGGRGHRGGHGRRGGHGHLAGHHRHGGRGRRVGRLQNAAAGDHAKTNEVCAGYDFDFGVASRMLRTWASGPLGLR